jgi:hypothetical protein
LVLPGFYLVHSWMSVDGSSGLLLELREVVWVVGQVGKHHSLLVVVLAQDLVVAQKESVTHAKPKKPNINTIYKT